jgi:HNH endonuclease
MTKPKMGPDGKRLRPRRGAPPAPEVDRKAGIARFPLYRQDGSRAWAVVDLADAPLVESHRWYEVRCATSVYARTTIRSGKAGSKMTMHRLLAGDPVDLLVDHKDGDGLNNRRGNLRIATPSQNRANEIRLRGGTSTYKGVTWIPDQGVYVANMRRYLGRFPDEVSAALAYDDAARATFGAFARTNFTEEEARSLARSPRLRRPQSPHGRTRYARHKCRCEICVTANRVYMDAYRAARRKAA